MAQKKTDTAQYDALRADLAAGTLGNFYIFHGQERYLLEHFLQQLRKSLIPEGMADFNYRRYEGKDVNASVLQQAVDALPAFAERTLVEIHDYDVFSLPEEERNAVLAVLSDLPDYVCLVLVYDTLEYKPDGRMKSTAAIRKLCRIVEFPLQDQARLIKWIKTHFASHGKKIDTLCAEHLAFITGGSMTALSGEIEKVSAYAAGETVTLGDIDAVVEPVLEAVVYKLTDALTQGNYGEAARITGDFLLLRESPQKIMYSITSSFRKLYAAKLCSGGPTGVKELMDLCDIRYDFQARNLLKTAASVSRERCRRNVLLCARSALAMNSGADPEGQLKALICDLAAGRVVTP